MDVLGELVDRDRTLEGPVLRTAGAGPDRAYDYHRFATTAMKTGNFLRLHGVRAGATVGIVTRPVPEPVLGWFGAVLLGAGVRFDPPAATDAAAVVLPTDRVEGYDPAPGTTVIAYGAEPTTPAVEYFERGVWSENPSFPPTDVAPDTPAIRTADGALDHRTVLEAADRLVERLNLEPGTAVALRASMAAPWAFVAGVVAPVLAGATTVLVDDADSGPVGDLAVATGSAPEATVVGPDDVALPRPG